MKFGSDGSAVTEGYSSEILLWPLSLGKVCEGKKIL